MTIVIPSWLLWTLGICAGVVVGALAWFGAYALWSMRGPWWR